MSQPLSAMIASPVPPGPRRSWLGLDGAITLVLLLAAALSLPLLHAAGDHFWPDIVNRAMILAIAATSLNLLVGLGGLVSFGHAVYLGLGAYAMGIATDAGVENGFAHLGLAIAVSGIFALLTGLVALRTKGAHFIMLTMAFAQMMYFVMVGLKQYGGDDGLSLDDRSVFPAPFGIENNTTFFYVTLLVLAVVVLGLLRLRASRFGLVLMAAKGNERRVRTEGFDPFRYRLVAYVLAGVVCGVAGFLQANLTSFVSPNLMSWSQSGDLLFMVILGGTGSAAGPMIGALLFLMIQELLGSVTIYWTFFFGLALLAVALFGTGGLMGLVLRAGGRGR
jgi:branched-chain amino acid transport system permease protein